MPPSLVCKLRADIMGVSRATLESHALRCLMSSIADQIAGQPRGDAAAHARDEMSPAASAAPAITLPAAGERELRLDLFRGLALWLIFIDHLPPNILTWL